ncbi:MAG TPA: hypothetical protein VHM20_07655, partial [Gammaproteobacteria bacterium]|nr:hypothetical protein [Gammaproteobacteria bacterium]
EKQKLEDQKKEKAIIDDISLAAEMLEDLKEYIKNECLLDEDESESEDEREVNPHFPLDEEYMKELIYNEAALIKNKIDTFKDFEVTDKGKSAKSFLLFEPGAIMGRFSPLIAKNRSNVKKNLEDLMKLCELPMHAEKNRKSTISKSSRG